MLTLYKSYAIIMTERDKGLKKKYYFQGAIPMGCIDCSNRNRLTFHLRAT